MQSIGLGSRSRMFATALLQDYADHGELVALCDPNQTRLDYTNQYYAETLDARPVPTYRPEDFDRMVRSDASTALSSRPSTAPTIAISSGRWNWAVM